MPLFYAKPTEKEVITKLIFSNKTALHDFLEADNKKEFDVPVAYPENSLEPKF